MPSGPIDAGFSDSWIAEGLGARHNQATGNWVESVLVCLSPSRVTEMAKAERQNPTKDMDRLGGGQLSMVRKS